MEGLFHQFVTLWVVIDPIGSVPVFIAVTAGLSPARRRKVAIEAVLLAAAVLTFFLVVGQFLLEALGIHLVSFQISGSIVLFIFALTMIFGQSKPEEETELAAHTKTSIAVFPLAVPSVAGPGSMLTIVLLTDNNRFSITEQAMTWAMMLAVLSFVLLFFLAAGPIQRIIGMAGAAIVSRVMGMVLAALAIDMLLGAVLTLVETPSF